MHIGIITHYFLHIASVFTNIHLRDLDSVVLYFWLINCLNERTFNT